MFTLSRIVRLGRHLSLEAYPTAQGAKASRQEILSPRPGACVDGPRRSLRSLGHRGLIITCLWLAFQSVTAPEAVARSYNYKAAARSKFQAGSYDEAIRYYRKHLRRAPRDSDTWTKLGASYYHTGLPKRALRYLKHVEKKAPNKTYNYYYQGLAFLALERPDKAKQYFHYVAARSRDRYAGRSTFEMAALEYNDRDAQRARYWLTRYMQQYPRGAYRAQATRMLQSLRTGQWLDKVEGIKRPDMETALYKYNKYSLYEKPHFWFLQGGWRYVDESGQEPAPQGGIKSRSVTEMALIANGGVGIGPWRKGPRSAFGGYTYRQLWRTDYDRIDAYLGDPTDIQYFPFRGDLLERRHQFYGDFRRQFLDRYYYGVFGRYELARIGSTIFPGPGNGNLSEVLKISDTQLLIPWVGMSYWDNYRTLFYLYMRKQLNDASPEHSNKTYSLGLDGGEPTMSFGISHSMEFPDHQITAKLELFRYEFIYNDFWLDYKRDGFIAGVEHEVIPEWYINGLVGYYQDTYILPRLKLSPCSAEPTGAPTGGGQSSKPAPNKPNQCSRIDTGTLVQAGVYWNWTQFQRFSGYVQMVENRNAELREFDENKTTFQISYTMAFPSVTRVSRFVERYADTAFTKEAQ